MEGFVVKFVDKLISESGRVFPKDVPGKHQWIISKISGGSLKELIC